MSSLYKRSYIRFPISHDASAAIKGSDSGACEIINFSHTGVFLSCDSRKTNLLDERNIGKSITITIKDDSISGSKLYKLSGNIVRLTDGGMGIEIEKEHPEVYQYFKLVSRQQIIQKAKDKLEHTEINDSNAVVITASKLVIDHFANNLLYDFFQLLGSLNSDLRTNQLPENSRLTDLINTVELYLEQKHLIVSDYLNVLDECMTILDDENFKKDFEMMSDNDEALLLDDEMDDWYIVTSIIQRVERMHTASLSLMEQRFNKVAPVEVNNMNNPAGPYVLSHILRETVNNNINLKQRSHQVFEQFEQVLSERYQVVINRLDEVFLSEPV